MSAILYLIGSIIFTSWLTLSFKVVEKLKLNNLQVIVFNYYTCIVTGSIIAGGFSVENDVVNQPWFLWALVMGGMFVLSFNLVAITAQKSGVAVASVAYKLSLVIPFLFSIYFYKEQNSVLKSIGIAIAVLSVILTCFRPESNTHASSKKINWFLPVLLFVASGLVDTMIKYVEQRFLDGSNNNHYLVSAFFGAAMMGTAFLAVLLFTGKQHLSWKAALMGISIGIPNYLSIWCLVKVLKDFGENSSAIIPINNMGIVLFSAIVAYLVFHERLSRLNWTGIILSLVAISLIAFG